MKRFAIILLAVATALVMALPATAKKPVPEPEPPVTYVATIQATGIDGVETSCEPGLVVTRTDERRGPVTHFESGGATLDINAPGLAWDGTPIEGCRGTVESPEYFRIAFDGEQVAMLWIFDVDVIERPVTLKNGKIRYEEARTDFRMGGPYAGDDFAAWGHSEDDHTGVITTDGTGTFCFVRYEQGGDPMFTELESWCQEFALHVTLTPTS